MIYIVMGVSGSGKTTVSRSLAWHLKIPYFDADDFHPDGNIKKMASGIPLEDEDRWPWLKTMRELFTEWEAKGGAILACSALKESYRQLLMDTDVPIKWIYLAAEYDTIYNRIKNRRTHYMKTELLQSQFDTLEVPLYGIHVSIKQGKKGIIEDILNILSYDQN